MINRYLVYIIHNCQNFKVLSIHKIYIYIYKRSCRLRVTDWCLNKTKKNNNNEIDVHGNPIGILLRLHYAWLYSKSVNDLNDVSGWYIKI